MLIISSFANDITSAQRNSINKAFKTGGKLVIKPTRKQIEGGFLGTLASIGIPMAVSLVSKMFGSGLQVDNRPLTNTRNVYVAPSTTKGQGYYPYRSPPFHGRSENPIGMGVKKNAGKGLLLGANSPFKTLPILRKIL